MVGGESQLVVPLDGTEVRLLGAGHREAGGKKQMAAAAAAAATSAISGPGCQRCGGQGWSTQGGHWGEGEEEGGDSRNGGQVSLGPI